MSAKKKQEYYNGRLTFRVILLFSLAVTSSICSPIFAQRSSRTLLTRQQSSNPRASADESAVKVPFDLYGNNILVQISVNNSPPLWFVFDSGANVNVINERLARKLKLAIKGGSTLDANGGTASGSFVEDTTINISSVKVSNQTIFAVPLDALAEYSGRDVQGILGNNFIQNFVVEIDYANQTLIFHNPQIYNLAGMPDTIELENRDGNPFIKAQLSLDAKTIITDSFEIDTGSNGIFSIYRPFAEKHRLLQSIPKANIAEGTGGAGVGGTTKYLDARIRSITLGKYVINQPLISISQGAESSGTIFETGFIGTDLLRRFTVTLDYGSKRMRLVPNKNFNAPFEADMSGLELVSEANNYKIIKIKNVRANFPAAKASLREGDEIVTVNNRPAAEYGLDRLSKMFKKEGKEYKLLVKRDDKIITTKLKMKRVI